MTEGTLFPAYGLINSHSPYGSHAAIVCTREWSATPLVPGNELGSFTNWSGFPCDGQEMFDDLLNTLAVYNPAGVIFDSVTMYTLDTDTSPAIPRATWAAGINGSNATPGWSKATQRAWMFRDTEWNMAKLYQLDTGSNNDFAPVIGNGGLAPAIAVEGAFTSLSWAFSSRKGFRPQTLTKVTMKLNDKLRAEYDLD